MQDSDMLKFAHKINLILPAKYYIIFFTCAAFMESELRKQKNIVSKYDITGIYGNNLNNALFHLEFMHPIMWKR